VLKLVYHTGVFGPIDLEYDRPLIRVGSSEDNDLVLRHPSIEPYHCLLLFRGERLLCLPPINPLPSPGDHAVLNGPEFGLGDTLTIGELRFSLLHSSNTIALPELQSAPPLPELPPDLAAPPPAEPRTDARYYCPHCRVVVPEEQLKRVGLVGHPKRILCPKCSHLFETQPEPPKPEPPSKKSARSLRL